MNRRPQTDFLNLGAHPMPPIPIDLRGDVRCTDAAAMDATTAAYAANDPLPAPPGMSDDDFDHEPCPPSLPTTQAMALKAGQKAMRETGIEITDDDLRRYGLHPGDYLPSEPSGPATVPGDSPIYQMFSDDRGRARMLPKAWEETRREQRREAASSAAMLVFGLLGFVVVGAVIVFGLVMGVVGR